MAFFNEFPNTRTYDKDLGWLIHVVGQLQIEVKTFIENNTINIPDQITWDITKQYTRNTLVIDYDGTAYLSKQPVPVGIAITNTDYWMPIFNYDDSINTLRANIAANERNHTTASAERHAGDLVWLGNALYKVTADMPAGTAYIPGTNVELYTVADYLLFLKGAIAAEAQARESADAALQENIDAEALARQGADNTLQGNIDAEAQARQDALTALQGNIDAEAQTRQDMDTAIQNNIDNIRAGGLTLLIGDSYGEGAGEHGAGTYTSWCDFMKTSLGWTEGDQVYTNAYGGSGFAAALVNKSFNTLLDELNARVPDHRHGIVQKIIVAGGYNDSDPAITDAAIVSGISTFMQHAREYFPHARVYCAHIGWTRDIDRRVRLNDLIRLWKDTVPKFGGSYIQNSEYILHHYNWFSTDGVHPNNDGQRATATQLVNALLTGSCDVSYYSNFAITRVSYLSAVTLDGFISLRNDTIKFLPNGNASITFNSGINVIHNTMYGIGDITSDLIRSYGNEYFNGVTFTGSINHEVVVEGAPTRVDSEIHGVLWFSGSSILWKIVGNTDYNNVSTMTLMIPGFSLMTEFC